MITKRGGMTLDILAIILGFIVGVILIPNMRNAKKPALYLYPIKKMPISVRLHPKGRLTKTFPLYKNGWNVIAEPDGQINGKYPYLFYEALIPVNKLPAKGWVVKQEHLQAWFTNTMNNIGFNKKEIKDFNDYWLNELVDSEYYEIYLLPRSFVNKMLNVVITPQPDTFIRALFYFKKGSANSKLEPPSIRQKQRTGFVATEWGGIKE